MNENENAETRKWLGYENTEDRIFILSKEELSAYFPNDKERSIVCDKKVYPEFYGYWVRTPERRGEDVTIVTESGEFEEGVRGRFNWCQCNTTRRIGVRVAMWVCKN